MTSTSPLHAAFWLLLLVFTNIFTLLNFVSVLLMKDVLLKYPSSEVIGLGAALGMLFMFFILTGIHKRILKKVESLPDTRITKIKNIVFTYLAISFLLVLLYIVVSP